MSQSFDKLVEIMAQLRSASGCPWDKEQDHKSLIPYLIEEAYEVVGAIDSGNNAHLCEELGDLLLQIVFHAQMAQESKAFTIENVIKGITEKLIRRHPHVFGDIKLNNADEVLKNWDKIKRDEKKNHQQDSILDSILDSIPKIFPQLMQAYKLSKKAAKQGFDWDKVDDVLAKIKEEMDELKEAIDKKNIKEIQHEIGDLFFALVNYSRHLKIDPEEALRQTNERFRERFKRMEQKIRECGKNSHDLSPNDWDRLWNQVKEEIRACQ